MTKSVRPGSTARIFLLASTAIALLWPPDLAAQTPLITSDFVVRPTRTGRRGNELVTADWATNWNAGLLSLPLSEGAQGAIFDDTSKPYDIVIGAGADLYTITDTASNQPQPSTVTLAPGSSLTNYGIMNTYFQTYPLFSFNQYSNHSAPIVNIGNDVQITNYGVIGFLPYNNAADFEAVFAASGSTGVVIDNYGLMGGDAGVRADAGKAVTVYNHAGGILEAGEGNGALGPSTYNFQDGGITNQKVNGSYCEHAAVGDTLANWGFCMGSSKGYYIDQGSVTASDYGGPLVPAALDRDGNIMFNGVLGSTWESVTGLPTYCSPNGLGTDLDAGAVQFNNPGSGPEVLNFYNTIYRIEGTRQTVNYLPSMFGWPIENHVTGTEAGNSTVNFYFSGLTAAQETAIQTAVAGSQNVSPGGFTLDGSSFYWCTLPHINAYFSDTVKGTGIKGNPKPGISYQANGTTAFYTEDPSSPNYQTNPYYLTNAATVLLTGSLGEQPGTTTIAPGWTLVIGSNITTYSYATQTTSANPMDDDFGTNPAPSDAIDIQGAEAVTKGNIDGKIGQRRFLTGALVVNNPTQAVTLPNLTGPGLLIQVGRATTTLAGTSNTLTGPIYLRDGTLAIGANAGFATPPVFSFGAKDTITYNLQTIGISPELDLSALGMSRFTVGGLTVPGPQSQFWVSNFYDGYSFPRINLGSATLVVGDGVHTTQSTFLGGLIGSGGMEIAPNTTFSLGGVSTYYIPGLTKAEKLSTYAGGTVIDRGATLVLQNEGVTGTGLVQNEGTVKLNSTMHIQDQTATGITAPSDLSLQNLVASVPANYVQTATGTLVIRVHGDDGTGAPGSGAGFTYDTLAAGNAATLAGTLNLAVIDSYKPKSGGSTLTVVTAPGGITGKFDSVVSNTNVHIGAIVQTVTANTVTMTLMPK